MQSVTTLSGMGDSQLVQELNHKNKQLEILHVEIRRYADSLEKEKKKVSLLIMDNQSYQHQLQHQLQEPPALPPRSPIFVSDNYCFVASYVLLCSSSHLSLVLT